MATPTATDVLRVAAREIGVSEYPPGSNRVKYTTWYGMGPVAWCAIFASWVAAQAGATSIIPRHAYTPSGAAWFKNAGQWYTSPKVGDLVYYTWPNMGRISHVGFVEAVHAGGLITTIEGNTDSAGGRTGGRVMRQSRSRYMTGYGRPKYGTGTVPTPIAPPFPLPKGWYFGPKDGPTESVSGYYGHRDSLRQWQTRMKYRGWTIVPDGLYGPTTAAVAKAFQKQCGLTVDGLIGPNTWKSAWTAKITPA